MHASSMINMRACAATYADEAFHAARARVAILELGSADVNGSYRSLFRAPNVHYTGVDLAPGSAVDVVLQDAYNLPFDDASMDLVLSGQMFEHCEFFWLAFREMMRVLKPDGFIFLIAPSAGQIHRFPVDCYRFYPDAYQALAKDSGGHVVDLWLDDRGPWCDLTGVFARTPIPARPRVVGTMAPEDIDAVKPPRNPGGQEVERFPDGVGYLEVLNRAHSILRPELYLEVGVREGASLSLARGRAIGVDPWPRLSMDLRAGVEVVSQTSDAFFATRADAMLAGGVDLAFIDGMHWAEFALRDFISIERHSRPWSVTVLDDIFPAHEVQARRLRETVVWTGDVWRAAESLRRHRPDLFLLLLSTSPTGLVMVAGLKPGHKGLVDSFNPVMSELRRGNDEVPPPSILERHGALTPDDGRVVEFLSLFASLRSSRARVEEVAQALATWRQKAGL